MATNGRRRTKGAGSIIHRKDGSWEFRREVGRDPATGKRRYVSAKGRTKAGARERFDARIAEMERTGLLSGAKSPYLKDYAERWLVYFVKSVFRVGGGAVFLDCDPRRRRPWRSTRGNSGNARSSCM